MTNSNARPNLGLKLLWLQIVPGMLLLCVSFILLVVLASEMWLHFEQIGAGTFLRIVAYLFLFCLVGVANHLIQFAIKKLTAKCTGGYVLNSLWQLSSTKAMYFGLTMKTAATVLAIVISVVVVRMHYPEVVAAVHGLNWLGKIVWVFAKILFWAGAFFGVVGLLGFIWHFRDAKKRGIRADILLMSMLKKGVYVLNDGFKTDMKNELLQSNVDLSEFRDKEPDDTSESVDSEQAPSSESDDSDD